MLETLKFDLAAEVLTAFGEVRLPVTGSSMFPSLRPGDLLEIRVPVPAIEPGEVVVFEHHSRLVAHRVVHRAGDVLITRGDRLGYEDLPLSADEVWGRVTAIERGGRRRSPRLTGVDRLFSALLRHTEVGTRAALYFSRMIRYCR